MLEDIPLFSCLDAEAVRDFEKVATRKRFPKNAIVFSRGDESDSLYIVRSGKVKAVIHDEEGKEIVLADIGEGEYFGEMGVLDGVPRSATIVTQEPTEMLVIRRNDFKKLLSANPDMAFNLIAVVLQRLRRADQKIESLGLRYVHGRVANLLMQSAEPQGREWVVKGKMTHQEIANVVGSSREMVSRILAELVEAGSISIEKRQITIHRKLA
jgi:CRP/FNR family transcriptional regulator, cyclic AMP receptor protein